MLGFLGRFFSGRGVSHPNNTSLIDGFEVPEPITSCGGSRNRHHTKVAEFLDGQDLIDNFMDYYDSMESIGFLFSRLCNCIETEKSVFQCKIR